VDFEIVRSQGFDGLADEWDRLARRSSNSTFARPGWISAWWTAFGRGELQLFVARQEGELVAVLPLARHRGILWSCSNVHTPSFDGVATGVEGLCAALLAALSENPGGVVLSRVEADGPLASAAKMAAAKSRSRVRVLSSESAGYADPQRSWGEYWRSLPKGRRNNVERRRRGLSKLGEISFETYDGKARFESLFDEFLSLEATGWKVRQGTAVRQRPHERLFYEAVAAWAAEEGILRLSFMSVDDRRVAAEMSFDDGARRYGLKIGRDDEYSRFAVGVQLGLAQIRNALEAGRIYEFGTGGSTPKNDFSNAERLIEEIALFPRSVRGTATRWTASVHRTLRSFGRDIAPLRAARDAMRRRAAGGGRP
jgi:CelD/BcsL family acetyltransferase involved in cellulose biosynthesis